MARQSFSSSQAGWIHSAQALIGRQQPIREFFPVTGHDHLVVRALHTASLAASPRILLCGGEERGTWLLERGTASPRTFAFTLALSRDSTCALGRIVLENSIDATPGPGALALPDFFDALKNRRPLDLAAAPGTRLSLAWLA